MISQDCHIRTHYNEPLRVWRDKWNDFFKHTDYNLVIETDYNCTDDKFNLELL